MDKATRQMLNNEEQATIRLIESKQFAKLDADELIDLHTRVRRIRNKYSTLVRRRGAAKVRQTGSRALATKAISKTSAKAEVFEDALSTVSARLAKVTAANAKALKADRLAAARATKTSGKKVSATKAAAKRTSKKTAKRAPKSSKQTPASKRDRAAARASGKRKQAKRDKR